MIPNSKDTGADERRQGRKEEMSEAAPAATSQDSSKKALHVCLDRVKDAKDESKSAA